ncbi:MAG: DUF5675 family protein [Pseudomonadota bacterium]
MQYPTVPLLRLTSFDHGTPGRVITPGGFSCRSLELPWRGNAPDVSCIEPGTHLCLPYSSKKFGQVYHLQDVHGRTWILTHAGNFAGDRALGWKTDSAGCILFGNTWASVKLPDNRRQLAVLLSKVTMTRFIAAMNYQPFYLKVVGGIYARDSH